MRPDDESSAGSPERGSRFVFGLLVFALLLGVCMIREGLQVRAGPPQPDAAAAGTVRGEGASVDLPPPAKPLPPSVPVGVRIPSIKVKAPLMKVGLDDKGWIQAPPPENDNLAGWYRDAATPGSRGTAVIVGHVDNTSGPSVFYDLGALRRGRSISVTREDGRTAVFSIYGIEVFDKDAFPGERVYGDTGYPELRVITCGGGYSKETGYQGNLVVFARMTKAR